MPNTTMDYAQTNRFIDNLSGIIAKFSTEYAFSHITDASADVLQQRVGDANCLFNPNEFAIKPDVINEYFSELLPLFERFFKGNRRDLSILRGAMHPESCRDGFCNSGEIDLSGFLHHLLSKDVLSITNVARCLGIKLDFLTLFALYFQRPFLSAAGTILKGKITLDKWTMGYCPVCGAWAAFGKIPEESDVNCRLDSPLCSERILWCCHCDTEWRFPKLQCPFCRNENTEDLIFAIKDAPKYRIKVCEKCRRYIRLRDCQSVPEISPADYDREYLMSTPLDLMAMENDYIREYLFFSGIPTTTVILA